MKKVIKSILSYNWGALFWTIVATYYLHKFIDPEVGGGWFDAFCVVGSIVLLVANLIQKSIKLLFSLHKIAPPEVFCFVISADRALYYFNNTDIPFVYMQTTNHKYTQVGYYKRGLYSWVLVEAEKP